MSTFTPTIELDQKPSRGGRGPGGIDRTPRGGGDGQPPYGFRPNDRLRRYRLGLAVGLASVLMLFIGLTSAYIVRQGVGEWNEATGAYITDWKPLNIPAILWINSALLLLSSFTIELARRSIFRQASELAVFGDIPGYHASPARFPWLGATVVLGLGFLAGQYMAWLQLRAQGIFISSNPSSSFFYVLTATHAVHLLGGVIALLYAFFGTRLGRPLESRQIAVDVTAWYWHFMGLLWLYIFALLQFYR